VNEGVQGEEKKENGNQEENKIENKEEKNTELTEEQNKNKVNIEEFNKLTPEEQKEVLSKRVATKKIRCKMWPGCKDPNCIYAHPTERVSIFYIILF
jgi:hypothetical protein